MDVLVTAVINGAQLTPEELKALETGITSDVMARLAALDAGGALVANPLPAAREFGGGGGGGGTTVGFRAV